MRLSKKVLGVIPLIQFIQKIKCDGGGDFPEAVEKALAVAVAEAEVSRVILIGDAPPHANRDYREQAIALGQKQRPVFSFVVGKDAETYQTFTEISRLSGGLCQYLENNEDLINFVAVTVVEQMGGKKSLDSYVKRYQKSLSPAVERFIKQLPSNVNPQ